MKNGNGYTLIELMVVSSILLILTAISLYSINTMLIRAKIAGIHASFSTIENALELYYADNSSYPLSISTYQNLVEIHEFISLTTPITYLQSIPKFPWKDNHTSYTINGVLIENVQRNYVVFTNSSRYIDLFSISYPGWAVFSGGPITVDTSSNPNYWYSPTNGILSYGGFWSDSEGFSNI